MIRNSSATKIIQKPVRGISEGKTTEEKGTKAVVQEGSGRKIIKVIPPRQGTPTNVRKQEAEDEKDLDDEIEELLIRNSLQLNQLRSEIR